MRRASVAATASPTGTRPRAAAFAAFAALCGFASLCGWVFDSPSLRGFGFVGFPIWPLSGLGYFALSIGYLVGVMGNLRLARLLWILPLAIALLALFERWTNIDIGIDRVLFPASIREYPFPHPGRPGVGPSSILILLTLAGYASRQERWLRDEVGSLLASAALALGATAVVFIMLSSGGDGTRPFNSLPGAIISIALAITFIAWNSDFGWTRLLASHLSERRRLLQALLPLVLVAPLIPSLLAILIMPRDSHLSLHSLIAIAFGNIVIVALVTHGAVIRIARDQAAMAEAWQALKDSEQRLATAAAAHELGVFEWDAIEGSITWSPGAEQRLGLEPGSMPDFDSWAAQIEPDDMANIQASIDKAVAQHADRFGFRYRFIRPNGDVRAVEGSSRIFYDADGRILRTVGVMMNVTERDEREAALRNREAQLRSVLESVPDAMVVIDEHGTIRQFSTAAEILWDRKAAEVAGHNFTMLVPVDERGRFATLFLARGRPLTGRVIQGTGEAADGRRFPVEIRAGIARSDGQTLFTVFFRDISERLAAEERMSELNSDLAHVSRQSAMSELAADMAHELNQPLAATSNFLAAARMLLESDGDRERAIDLLRLGVEQTQRAGQIIRRLRDFTARGDNQRSTQSVEATVRDAVELVLVGSGSFHTRVIFAFDPEAPEMFADRIQIQQVLVNLLRNAVHALRDLPVQKRVITIATENAGKKMIAIEVRDTGPGIPQAVLERMFSRFTTTKQGRGGMGIGLSISKRIVEAHGGSLEAANRPEGGAVFRFTVPAETEHD